MFHTLDSTSWTLCDGPFLVLRDRERGAHVFSVKILETHM